MENTWAISSHQQPFSNKQIGAKISQSSGASLPRYKSRWRSDRECECRKMNRLTTIDFLSRRRNTHVIRVAPRLTWYPYSNRRGIPVSGRKRGRFFFPPSHLCNCIRTGVGARPAKNTKQVSDPCLFSVAVMLIPSLVAWLQGAWHVNSSALFVPEMWWMFVGARQQIVS